MPPAKSTKNTAFDPMTLLLAGSESEGEEAVEAKILAEFNQAPKDDWVVAVSRWVRYSQPEERCFEATIDELKEIPARLASDWGPGNYIVRVRHNNLIVRSFRYAIASPRPGAAATNTMRSELGELARTFEMAMKSQQTMFEGFLNRLAQVPAAVGGGGRQTSVTELIDGIAKLQNLAGLKQEKSEGLSPEKIFEYVTLGLKIAGQRGGGGDKEQSWGDILIGLANSDLAKKIGELAAGGQLNLSRPALGSPGQPVAIAARSGASETQPSPGASSPTNTQQQPAATADQVQQFLTHQIAYLVGRAAQWKASAMQRSHPDLYAEWVVDNFPQELLVPLANAPNLLEQLQSIVPEVGAYADWFMALFESVRHELTEEPGSEDDEPLANGAPNGRDAASHVSATSPASAGEAARGQGGNP